VNEMVSIIFTYRLAAYYMNNIASLQSKSMQNMATFFDLVKPVFASEMITYKRFRGAEQYGDVAALSEMFRCPLDSCPSGRLSFADMYKLRKNDIDKKLHSISKSLSNIVDTVSFKERMAKQYDHARSFQSAFNGLVAYLPLILLIPIGAFCQLSMTSPLRTVAVLSSSVLLVLAAIIYAFADLK